jgi:hypothetical protein
MDGKCPYWLVEDHLSSTKMLPLCTSSRMRVTMVLLRG